MLHVITAPNPPRNPKKSHNKYNSHPNNSAAAPGDGGAEDLQPGGARACHAILAEIAAVLQACRPNNSPIRGSIQMPSAAMHLQAIVSAMDVINKCVSPCLLTLPGQCF